MKKLAPCLLLPLLSLGPPAVAAEGQEASPQPSFGERLEVQLVNVDVLVTDAHGRPVLDLGPADFRVFEDGEPVAITHFSAPAGAAAPAAAARQRQPTQPAAGAEPLRLVVFLDKTNLDPVGVVAVLRQLWGVLDAELRPGDEVMVVSYDGSVRFLTPGFTAERKQILAALNEATAMRAAQILPDLDERRVFDDIQESQRASGGSAAPAVEGTCIDAGYLAWNYAENVFHRVQQSLGAVGHFVRSLAGIPGRKVLLHVSDGIPMIAGSRVLNYAIELCDGLGMMQGLPFATAVDALGDVRLHRWDPFTAKVDMLRFHTSGDLERLIAQANAHRVSFYPVQATGLRNQGYATVEDARTTVQTHALAVRNEQEGLDLLAAETVGRALFNTNDFEPGLSRMVSEVDHQYLLAYVPPQPGTGERHRIRVEVDRPGVEVRFRKSYQDRSAHQRIGDDLLATLYHGRGENPLGVRLELARREPLPGDASRVVWRVELPLANLTLLPAEGRFRGLFTVFLAARDDGGATTPVRQNSVPVGFSAAEFETAQGKDFVYEIAMEMRNRPHEVALGLYDELAGTTSFLRRSARIPAQ